MVEALRSLAELAHRVDTLAELYAQAAGPVAGRFGVELAWVGARSSAVGRSPAGWTEVDTGPPWDLCLRVPCPGVDAEALQLLVAVGLAGDVVTARAALVAARTDEREATSFLRDVVEPMPIAVAVRRGPQQAVVHANAAARTILHRDVRPGRPRDLPEMAEAGLYRVYDEVLRTGEIVSIPQFRAMVGTPPRELLVDLTVAPVRGADGQVDGTALYAVDVTESTRRAREAEATERRLSQLLRTVKAIVWEFSSSEGAITYVNEGAADLLGYPHSDWLKPGFWRTVVLREDHDVVFGAPEHEPGEHELEYRVRAADGRVVWLHDSIVTLAGLDGTVVGQRGVAFDVTPRKEAERERERLQADMVEFQKLEGLGVMAGGIAHDFNNLLTVILGNASLAIMRLPSHSAARAALDDLIANAHRAADLTRQLLAYSGRAQFSTEALDLAQLVREIRGLVSAALPKSATLEVELNPLVPAVEGDRAQLQQVLMNLVNNAAEALGDRPGRVWVSTGYVALDGDGAAALRVPPGAYVLLEVRDDGCGMSDGVRRRIFDPFYTTKSHGRGLGLAAVLGIVRGHRGAIDVLTQEEAGTTVRVYLPVALGPAPRDERRGELRAGAGLVLIIDDEAEVRATAHAMLEALGYDVIEAEDGRAGLLAFDRMRDRLAAVLLDMTMPVMSGEEVFRALRQRDPGVRIVLSTGYSVVDARRRGLLDGSAAFLQKPYTIRQLGEAMAKALDPR